MEEIRFHKCVVYVLVDERKTRNDLRYLYKFLPFIFFGGSKKNSSFILASSFY